MTNQTKQNQTSYDSDNHSDHSDGGDDFMIGPHNHHCYHQLTLRPFTHKIDNNTRVR